MTFQAMPMCQVGVWKDFSLVLILIKTHVLRGCVMEISGVIWDIVGS